MIELRSIIIDIPDGHRRVRLFLRGERGDDYKTLEYPVGLKITRGAIINFLSENRGEKKKDIGIAPHVKIPEEK